MDVIRIGFLVIMMIVVSEQHPQVRFEYSLLIHFHSTTRECSCLCLCLWKAQFPITLTFLVQL